ncbi:hypothetical protein PMI08_02060 [Brevibacillus sp. CF112]|nr:hypothetical protein PMI08_02060 [Brevibacillus sp. CF112]
MTVKKEKARCFFPLHTFWWVEADVRDVEQTGVGGAIVRARCNPADAVQLCGTGRICADEAQSCERRICAGAMQSCGRGTNMRRTRPSPTSYTLPSSDQPPPSPNPNTKKRRRMPLAPSSLSTPLFFLHTHVENPIPVCYNGNWSLGHFSIYVHYNPNIIVPHWISFVKPSDQKWGMKKERYHERY